MKKGLMKIGVMNVILLGLVSLLNDFSSEMILPILPMFITALGGGGIIVGLIGGIRDAISHILKVFSGWWSDKIRKRKPFIFSGYLTSSIFRLFLGLSKTWPLVLLFASLERLGKWREAPRDALISESMKKHKGRGFGIQRAFDTTGAILGSIVVLLLVLFVTLDFNKIILIAAIAGFLTLIPLFFVREVKIKKKKIKKYGLRKLHKPLKLFIFISAIFALANFTYMFFILRARELFPTGDPRFAIAIPILLYVFFNIFYAGFAVPFGNLSDKIGRKKVLIAGYLLFALTCLGFAIYSSLVIYGLLFILYGLSFAMITGNQSALVSDLSQPEIRATALGIFQTTIGLIALPASLIAGWLWTLNTSWPFIYAAILSTLSVILFLGFGNYFKK